MKLYFLTLFPEVFPSVLSSSILGRALAQGLFSYQLVNIRDFALDRHKTVDDRPYGGGPGMVMKADVLERALLYSFEQEGIVPTTYSRDEYSVIVTSASGAPYIQSHAHSFSKHNSLFFISGHYEGIDQRFIDIYADHFLRIGDYVLTGGELPSLVMADSIIRLLPGVLGSENSTEEESFSFSDSEGLLLEYPHYTRPDTFHTLGVPSALLSGNHKLISDWRLQKSQEMRLQLEKPKH